MKKHEIINSVSKQIESLVRYEVCLLTDTPFKEKYENLVEEIEYMVDEARSLVDNFKEERLSINQVEAEGYLRGVITIKNLIS